MWFGVAVLYTGIKPQAFPKEMTARVCLVWCVFGLILDELDETCMVDYVRPIWC